MYNEYQLLMFKLGVKPYLYSSHANMHFRP